MSRKYHGATPRIAFLRTTAKLATRNVNDFENCGVSVVNPWIVSAT